MGVAQVVCLGDRCQRVAFDGASFIVRRFEKKMMIFTAFKYTSKNNAKYVEALKVTPMYKKYKQKTTMRISNH